MSQNDDLTNTLSAELEDRAHAMDGSTLHLTDVTGRARSIRRRRTATAVAGVAAVVAVIVPVATLATHGGGNPEPAPATQSITPTPDGSQPAAGVLDVSDLPTGDAPRMEYVTDGRTLHRTDGSTVEITTRHDVSSFVTLTDGTHVWLTHDKAGNAFIEAQGADGILHEPLRSYDRLRVNREHNTAGWVAENGQVTVWTVGATEPRPVGDPIPGTHDIRIAAILSQDCRDFCTVYVNAPAPGAQVWQPYEVTDDATEKYLDGEVMVNDVAGGLTIGLSELSDFGSCSYLFGGGEFQGFHTCKAELHSFSTDASTVLGYPTQYDGLGPTSLSMWDATGQKLFERRSNAKSQAFYTDAQWEDATHVLAPVFQDGKWSVVRIASDGSMEYAVPPVAGSDVDSPFVLATGGPGAGA